MHDLKENTVARKAEVLKIIVDTNRKNALNYRVINEK